MTPGDICVIIPVLNEAARIAVAIESIRDAGQVIVVDGGSSDATTKIAESFSGVEVVSSPRGRGRQIALGASLCNRSVMVLLHGDCQLSADSLLQVAKAVDDGHPWGAMQQRIDAVGLRYRMLERGNAARVTILGLPFGDQAMFIRRDIFDEVGGIEEIPLLEDVRLARRLRRVAWPVLVGASVIVDPRRWEKHGVIRQTMRNQFILLLHAFGVSPQSLASLYR
jgi:rSAM/selenodomain-associated transferase 2